MNRILVFAAAGALAACSSIRAGLPEAEADAVLEGPDGKQIGRAVLVQRPGGVAITLSAEGLTPGEHGFHIHENGRCDPPDFESAGGHFAPRRREHGRLNPKGAHLGDLGNVRAGEDGTVEANVFAEDAALVNGPMSIAGLALVLHGGRDDLRTDPGGDSGPRVACGVIRTR